MESSIVAHDRTVHCYTHGPMQYRFLTMTWRCVGFDGEGCELYLTDEEVYLVLKGRPLDRVAEGEFWWVSDQTATISRITLGTRPMPDEVRITLSWPEVDHQGCHEGYKYG